MSNKYLEFYEYISNRYIPLYELELIKKEYLNTYKELYHRKKLSSEEKSFLHDFKNVDNYINIHNNKVIDELRRHTDILNNINGYPLDEYQSRVVLSNERASLVVAGAGSGKSLTIIGKIVYLVKEKNVNPSDILCISFTNDATINLQKNIAKNYNFNIDIYTFHKLSLSILKQHNVKYQIAPDNILTETIDTFLSTMTNPQILKSYKYLIGPKPRTQDVLNIKRLIETFISLYKSNNYDLQYFITILKNIHHTFHIKEYKRHKSLLHLIINIYLTYEKTLQEESALDFNDMINKSLQVLEKNGLKKKWRYVIVDEYQDTSLTKFNLIKKIIDICQADFLAVGDDFQSIYRFTGCNLQIFLNFTQYFDYAKIFQIVNTYRNPQELINVAGSFIMKNKAQQRKNLISNKHLEKPIIIYYHENKVSSLKETLKLAYKDSKEILVLGRNNKDIKDYIDDSFTQKADYYTFSNITFRYLTMHKSKGLESENVILINIEDSILGMPTQMKEEKILKYVNNTKDYYPFEEERRLFYVALTRTKNKTYIISSIKKESIFTKEIAKYKKYVKVIKK